jgi:hypothetical protein
VSYLKDNGSTKISEILPGVTVAKNWGTTCSKNKYKSKDNFKITKYLNTCVVKIKIYL